MFLCSHTSSCTYVFSVPHHFHYFLRLRCVAFLPRILPSISYSFLQSLGPKFRVPTRTSCVKWNGPNNGEIKHCVCHRAFLFDYWTSSVKIDIRAGDIEDSGLLRCDALSLGRWFRTFRRSLVPACSGSRL